MIVILVVRLAAAFGGGSGISVVRRALSGRRSLPATAVYGYLA